MTRTASLGRGEPFRAALDREFEETLPILDSSFGEGGRARFELEIGCDSIPEKVYVSLPTFLLSRPLDASEAIHLPLDAEEKTVSFEGRPVFTIESVTNTKLADGTFQIEIAITPAPDAYPMDVTLRLGDVLLSQVFGGSTVFSYGNDTGFEPNTLRFTYNIGALDSIDHLLPDAVLTVNELLTDVPVSGAKLSAEPEMEIAVAKAPSP